MTLTLRRRAGPRASSARSASTTISCSRSPMSCATRRDAPISVRPFGVVRREGMPQDYRVNSIVHQGLIGAFGPDNTCSQATFSNADKHARDAARGRVGDDERIVEQQGQGGWFGITDHYWLTAIVPDQSERVSAYFDSRTEDDGNDFRAAYRGAMARGAGGRRNHLHPAPVRRRQAGRIAAALPERARHSPLRRRRRLGQFLVPDAALLSVAACIRSAQMGRQFRHRHSADDHRHQAADVPARLPIVQVDGEDARRCSRR